MEQSQQEQPITRLSPDAKALLNLFINWHGSVNQELNHLLSIPDTEDLQVTDHDTGKVTVYDPIQRQAFFAGIAVALTTFKDVPFLQGSTE